MNRQQYATALTTYKDSLKKNVDDALAALLASQPRKKAFPLYTQYQQDYTLKQTAYNDARAKALEASTATKTAALASIKQNNLYDAYLEVLNDYLVNDKENQQQIQGLDTQTLSSVGRLEDAQVKYNIWYVANMLLALIVVASSVVLLQYTNISFESLWFFGKLKLFQGKNLVNQVVDQVTNKVEAVATAAAEKTGVVAPASASETKKGGRKI
jgi:hypothetical protein